MVQLTVFNPQVRQHGKSNTVREFRCIIHFSITFTCASILLHSFQGKEIRGSPRRRSDGRLSRTVSTENEPSVEVQNKEAEENKENMRLDEYYSDQDSWNESVISGL